MGSIPPPDGEDVHESETAMGDWSLVIAEAHRASASTKETKKVTAFDLVAALGAQHAAQVLGQTPMESGAWRRAPSTFEASDQRPVLADAAPEVAIAEVAATLPEVATVRSEVAAPERAPRGARRRTPAIERHPEPKKRRLPVDAELSRVAPEARSSVWLVRDVLLAAFIIVAAATALSH